MTWAQYYIWGMHLFWWFFWLVGLGVLLYVTWPGRREARRDLSHEALRRHYVDGEITEDEYRRRLAVLHEDYTHARDHLDEDSRDRLDEDRVERDAGRSAPPPVNAGPATSHDASHRM